MNTPMENKQRPGGASSIKSNESNDMWKWVAGLLALIAAVVLAFFLLGGDADIDAEPGDIELPAVDADVDAPDVDVETPDTDIELPDVDVDVDPGSVDTEGDLEVDVDEGDAEAEAGN